MVLTRKTIRLRGRDYDDGTPGKARARHGGALVWAVFACFVGHGAGRAGRPEQRVPAGMGGAGHARDSLQAVAALVGVKSLGHPAGLGFLREHSDRVISPPRSGRPEWIHTRWLHAFSFMGNDSK